MKYFTAMNKKTGSLHCGSARSNYYANQTPSGKWVVCHLGNYVETLPVMDAESVIAYLKRRDESIIRFA